MSLFRKKFDPVKIEELVEDHLHLSKSNPFIDELVEHYKLRLLAETNLEHLISLSEGERRLTIERLINQFMAEEKVIIPRSDKDILLSRIIDESVGFGPLESLLNDESITEILVNGPNEVFIEKKED